MDYNPNEIERRWRARWKADDTYRVSEDPSKPKFYILDMFPYPSGAGLHVGHPLGYIASDIYARYKRACGFNVLHPMGYDAFGLPAEQYALQTGRHPALTTDQNVTRYREQLDRLGLSFDLSREVRTSDPEYYHWTQWTFLQLFGHWYDRNLSKARPIAELEQHFAAHGTAGLNAHGTEELHFQAAEWAEKTASEKENILQNYRLAFRAEATVNWCAALGTVLANDEVAGGLSERGGHPVEQKRMTQWMLRISAYTERLLKGLDTLLWSDSLKEIQRNWIGRSEGAQVFFPIDGSTKKLEVFTTRPDTIFGVTFMVLAPEHELVGELTVPAQAKAVAEYIAATKKRSERERIAQTRHVSGVATGSYALNPFTGVRVPIYLSDYVLAGYGTGAIMAVPAHDSRDWAFAKHFDLPIIPVVEGGDVTRESYDAKQGRLINSGFLNGLDVKEAIGRALTEISAKNLGQKIVNYRLRDATFSRQRYWGEPIPIYYKEGIPTPLPLSALPLELPETDDFRPTAEGEPPLKRVKDWSYEGYPLETSTMPGFAGSSAYYLRYMSPHDRTALVSKQADRYWRDVDLYVGGIEHATGHLLYARFWNMFLHDIGVSVVEEPFLRLVNQGMIQGRSSFVYRIVEGPETGKFVSFGLREKYKTQQIHVDVNRVHADVLDIDAFRLWRPAEFADAEFILEDGKYICGWAVEKMSKSMFNVVNPDQIVDRYGADTLRMYEMFLGPLEQAKPWDTNGIDGVAKFLRRFWALFYDRSGAWRVTDAEPTAEELKVLHKTIRKIREDIEAFSLNTAVSAFMICLNELGGTTSKSILEPLTVLLAPFAPHISEELWHALGNETSVVDAPYPDFDERRLQADAVEYPVSVNGKLRFKRTYPAAAAAAEIQADIVQTDEAQKWLSGNPPQKVIVVPGKIINIVI